MDHSAVRFPRPPLVPRPNQYRTSGLCVPCLAAVFAGLMFVGYFSTQAPAPVASTLSTNGTSAATATIEVTPAPASEAAAAVVSVTTRPTAKPDPKVTTSIKAAWTTADYDRIGKVLDPDVMQSIPQSFDPKVLNPCWNLSTKPQCLPYFYFLGGFQSGTYTLYEKVSQHPKVAKHHNSRIHFWGEPEKNFALYMNELSGSFSAAVEEGKVLGDASETSFAFYWAAGGRAHRGFSDVIRPCWDNCTKSHPNAVRDCMEETCYPKAQAADQKVALDLGVAYLDLHPPVVMRSAYRSWQPFLIILLRDPIQRLHSAYWEYPHYKGKYGASPAGFLAYVKEQLGELRACMSRGHSDLECVLLFESLGKEEEAVFFHCDQIVRGVYSMYVKVWLQHFPRDKLMFIRSEDYFADVPGTVKAVMSHLKLPEVTTEELARFAQARPHHSWQADGKPMLPEAWRMLDDFYRPYNEELAKLLGDNKFAWADKPLHAKDAKLPNKDQAAVAV